MDYQHLISDCVKQIPPSGIRKYFDLLDDSHISLGVGEPDFPTPDRIRKYVAERLKNERVPYSSNSGDPHLRELIIRFLSERYGIKNDITVSSFSRYSDIFTVHKEQDDENKIVEAVLFVAQEAIDSFIKMRESEGNKLKSDIIAHSDEIKKCVEFIEMHSPETVKIYNEKLIFRMKELLEDKHIDEQRILTEAAIFADKIAVAEETVRLRSHLEQLELLLNSDKAVGREMDFLVQEINREANTIGSKAQNVEIARYVVNIKAEIEKIREQIQNLE